MRHRWSRDATVSMLLLACLVVASACSTPPGPTAAQDTRTAAVRRTMEALVRAGDVPGIVVVLRHGGHVRVLADGLANTATRAPMTSEARFHVASLTKPVVAAVVLQLVQFGRLALDDTVESWLPGLVPRGDRITVEQLLNHTSGLPDYTRVAAAWPILERTPVDQRALVVAAGRAEPLFAPGAGQKYANTNYALLGLIVERATHQSLEAALDRRVFGPLGLRSASLRASRVDEPPVAHGYVHGTDATGWDLTWGWAAGGVVSDAPDIDRFFAALFSGELVGPGLVDAMVRPESGALGAWAGYGLGLARLQTPCGTAVGHSGIVDGFVSAAYTVRETGTAVVLMVNTDRDLVSGPLRDLLTTGLCGAQ